MTRVVVQKTPLFQKQRIKVEAVGDRVLMHFGNTEIALKYEAALAFSEMVRVQAKVAKRRVGDTTRSWRATGILSDAKQIASGRF